MIIKDSKSFGEAVKQYRKAQGLTQEKVANYSNVGVRFIVDLEKGKPTCELDKALRVAATIGIKLFAPNPDKKTDKYENITYGNYLELKNEPKELKDVK